MPSQQHYPFKHNLKSKRKTHEVVRVDGDGSSAEAEHFAHVQWPRLWELDRCGRVQRRIALSVVRIVR